MECNFSYSSPESLFELKEREPSPIDEALSDTSKLQVINGVLCNHRTEPNCGIPLKKSLYDYSENAWNIKVPYLLQKLLNQNDRKIWSTTYHDQSSYQILEELHSQCSWKEQQWTDNPKNYMLSYAGHTCFTKPWWGIKQYTSRLKQDCRYLYSDSYKTQGHDGIVLMEMR